MRAEERNTHYQYFWALPVVFLEFLCGALPIAVLPELQNSFFGDDAFSVIGISVGCKGILAFIFSPFVGALSDRYGRKWFMLITATGAASPVCFLSFTDNLWPFAFATGVSGIFASAMSIVFAYIAGACACAFARSASCCPCSPPA